MVPCELGCVGHSLPKEARTGSQRTRDNQTGTPGRTGRGECGLNAPQVEEQFSQGTDPEKRAFRDQPCLVGQEAKSVGGQLEDWAGAPV